MPLFYIRKKDLHHHPYSPTGVKHNEMTNKSHAGSYSIPFGTWNNSDSSDDAHQYVKLEF